MEELEFADQLRAANEMISAEKYEEALELLDRLKKIEKDAEYNYNLTHQLYQLDSNTRSLFNQKLILEHVNELSKISSSILFSDIKNKLVKENAINLDLSIIRREIELLVLRGLLSARLEEDNIVV